SIPVSTSTPIWGAWRCARRRSRLAGRSPRSARPASRPSWRCAIPIPTRRIKRSSWGRRVGAAASWSGTTTATAASSCPAPTVPRSRQSPTCCPTSTAGSARCEDASLSSTPRRLVTAERRDDEAEAADGSLRPQRLAEVIGQQQARSNLSVFIEAARARREPLDHVLFVGPPGLGKTTLAQIVARELGVNFRATSGPVIAKAGDLAALLTNLEDRDVLFIDEIHRLNPAVEEILYPAM